ncbi:MAG TPA: hypothetical protein VGM54_25740 [Chthoniobacter sp.]|jgi:hypothetical protein
MNKWLLLLVIIGLGVAGYLHRDTISGWLGHKTEAPAADDAAPTVAQNPAKASSDLAVKTYPQLGVQGSPFNIRFVANFNQMKNTNPSFLAQPDWPMQLATRTAHDLGMLPGAGATPAPAPFTSALDNRAYGNGATPAPTPPLLPGLEGSALDQKPKSSRGH